MTLAEAHTLVLAVLKQVMEEALSEHNVQLAQVRSSLSLFAFLLSLFPLLVPFSLSSTLSLPSLPSCPSSSRPNPR